MFAGPERGSAGAPSNMAAPSGGGVQAKQFFKVSPHVLWSASAKDFPSQHETIRRVEFGRLRDLTPCSELFPFGRAESRWQGQRRFCPLDPCKSFAGQLCNYVSFNSICGHKLKEAKKRAARKFSRSEQRPSWSLSGSGSRRFKPARQQLIELRRHHHCSTLPVGFARLPWPASNAPFSAAPATR